MSEKISNLPVATDVIGADVPVVQGGVNKKAASTLFGTIYPANQIPFGDGATAGGVTSSNLTWNETNKQFQAGDVLGAGNGLVTFLDDLNDFWYVGDSVTSSLYYAGANSGGIGAPLTGLGIDIKNDVYTLGNSSFSAFLRIDGANQITNLGNPSSYLQTSAGGNTQLGDINAEGNSTNINIDDASKTIFLNANSGFNFNGSNILNIGGKDIDYSAANAAGFWYNDGNGVISYVGGATDTFTSQDGKTVTVVNGLITSIV